MFLTILTQMILFILVVALVMASWFLGPKLKNNLEMLSPYESGFEPSGSVSAQSFSKRFFLITVLFLIFDVEIALIMPMIFYLELWSMAFQSVFFCFLLIVLWGGAIMEWGVKTLEWME